MFEMPAPLVNEMLACHWQEAGVSVQTLESARVQQAAFDEKLSEMESREIQFNF